MIQKPKIIFMGSGIFSVPVLKALLNNPLLSPVAVITQPDRFAGRKRVLTPTPLGCFADQAGIPCERVASVNGTEFLSRMQSIRPQLIVVVSFGQILRDPILNLPQFGCLNVHASILPKYRGASPITTCVLNGDSETGVTFMKMERGLDTGDIYEIHRIPVPSGITTNCLELSLSDLAGDKIGSCIRNILAGTAQQQPQPETGVSLAVKIKKTDGFVDWKEDASVLERKVRAYYNWPSMIFRIQHRGRSFSVKITKASCTSWKSPGFQPGRITAFADNKMMVACGTGSLLLERIIPEGKKEMSIPDFLNGTRLSVGDILQNGAPILQANT